MPKFRGPHRAPWWHYTNAAAYFVTICTWSRICHFGYIRNGIMCLSDLGSIAHTFWERIPDHFPFVSLGEFIIMPDHMHGLIIMNDDPNVGPLHATGLHSDHHATDIPYSQDISAYMSSISPKYHSLGSVIRSYKSAVSREIHLIDPEFKWQPRYYDHIIRDEKTFRDISRYILLNPQNETQHDFAIRID